MLVKIVRLPQFKAISFHSGKSSSPEEDAWARLMEFAEPKGFFDNPTVYQVFGRNNPMSVSKPELHGYEFLLTVHDDFVFDGDVREFNFKGGLFAVVSARGISQMQANWQDIVKWVGQHPEYTHGYPKDYDFEKQPALELEHHRNPRDQDVTSFLIDYYYPIATKKS
jgi:DNA gyrase inhibitor GyrI